MKSKENSDCIISKRLYANKNRCRVLGPLTITDIS